MADTNTIDDQLLAVDSICSAPNYNNIAHSKLPHVVKFSGGRSSASMTLSLAREGILRPERKDVVLFANTSAEHPETYKFAAKVCDELEQQHGLPCLWYEFCTVEMATRYGWARNQAYRLVRRQKATPEDDAAIPGYLDDGTTFEEATSYMGILPTRKMRSCTQIMKVLPGIQLISDWLGGGPGPAHAGHHHDHHLTSPEDQADRYKGNRLGREDYIDMRGFMHDRPACRPAQRWDDFTVIDPDAFLRNQARPKADIAGRAGPPVEYVTLLGLRADEPKRVTRAHFDAMLADGAMGTKCRHNSHPAGEIIATPLADAGATKTAVDEFWRRQPYDLGIDGIQGNCVYCFMKGESVIRKIAHMEQQSRNGSEPVPTPVNIRWWSDLEQKYASKSTDEDLGQFKYLGLRAPSYADIEADPNPNEKSSSNTLPCACTD